MSSVKKIYIGIVIFTLLFIGLIIFFIETTAGLRILVNISTSRVPFLKVGQCNGNLHNFYLKDISYSNSGIRMNVKEVHILIKINNLCRNHIIYINNLSLKDILLIINTKKTPVFALIKNRNSNSWIKSFIRDHIILNKILFNNIDLKINDTRILLNNLISKLFWQKENLTINYMSLHGMVVKIPKSNNSIMKIFEFNSTNFFSIKNIFNKNIKTLLLQPVIKKITSSFYLSKNWDIKLLKIENLHFFYNKDISINSLLFKCNNISNNINLNLLDINSNFGAFHVNGNIITQHNWPINIKIKGIFNNKTLSKEELKIKISGELNNMLFTNINLYGPINIIIYSKIELSTIGLPLSLELIAKQLNYAIINQQNIKIDYLKLKINNQLIDYMFSFYIKTKKNILPFIIKNKFDDNNQKINFFNLFGITNNFLIKNNIFKKFLPKKYQVTDYTNNTNLKNIFYNKNILGQPLELNLIIRSHNSLHNNNIQLESIMVKIIGNFKREKINIAGYIKRISFMQIMIYKIDLSLYANTNLICIKGNLGFEKLDLDILFNMRQLDNIQPWFNGKVHGLLKINGNIKSPRLLLNISADNLNYHKLIITHLCAKMNVQLTNNQINGDFNLIIKHIIIPEIDNIKLIILNIKGNDQEHIIKLLVYNKKLSSKIYVNGSIDRKKYLWIGRLYKANLSTVTGETWTANKTIEINYQILKQKIYIGSHCWNNKNSDICISQVILEKNKGFIEINFKKINLIVLKPFLTDNYQIDGIFNAQLNLKWDLNNKEPLNGNLIYYGKGIKFCKEINDLLIKAEINSVNANLQICGDFLKLKWSSKSLNDSQFNGQITISDLYRCCRLNGIIDVYNFNPITLKSNNVCLYTEEKKVGTFNSHLYLTGSVKKPQIFGYVRIDNININKDFFILHNIPNFLFFKFKGMYSILKGNIYTQQGKLNINGNIIWNKLNDWKIHVSINSKKINISLLPTICFDISTNIIFEAKPNSYSIYGQINILRANISIYRIPESLINIKSDNEVILRKNLHIEKNENSNTELKINIMVHIENNIYVNAFGLKGKLFGDLKIAQNRQTIGLNGKINISEGQFNAYGQDLIIRKGELLFSGRPDQPFINIEAIRNPELIKNNVIVGIHIIGLINEPKVEFFSDPIMPQQEIFSYLLNGREMINNQNDNTIIKSILISMGVTHGNRVISKIGKIFGINNLILDTQGIGCSSKLIISGFLLPNLQVQYSMGIFDLLSTFTLRYYLMPKLYMEAMTGVVHAINLMHKFEF